MKFLLGYNIQNCYLVGAINLWWEYANIQPVGRTPPIPQWGKPCFIMTFCHEAGEPL